MRTIAQKGNDVLGGLQGFNAVDMNQRTMYGAIGFREADDDAAFENHDVFGVADLVLFAVGKPHDKRLKRPPAQPFLNRFHVHAVKCTSGGRK